MLPSNMNLDIRSGTVGYNNKILVSDGKFSLGKNDKVNALVLEPVISMPSHKVAKIESHKTQHNQLTLMSYLKNQLSLTKRRKLPQYFL